MTVARRGRSREDGQPVGLGLLQDAGQAFFEVESVGHGEVGLEDGLAVAGRCAAASVDPPQSLINTVTCAASPTSWLTIDPSTSVVATTETEATLLVSGHGKRGHQCDGERDGQEQLHPLMILSLT